MRWLICILLAVPLPAPPQDGTAAAQKAIQALLELKAGDEEGFDAQADVLIQMGAEALDPLESAMKSQSGEKAFRLRRIRDMIWYPINIKGAYTTSVGNKEKAAKYGFALGVVALSFNGQAVTGHAQYSELLQEAEKRGDKDAEVVLFDKGRRRTVRIEGLRMGGRIANYPHALAEYIHEGDRAESWDEAVQQAITPWREGNRMIDYPKLTAAVHAGCRDTLVLYTLLEHLVQRIAPEELIKLWKEALPHLNASAYGGRYLYDCMYMAAGALLETGDLDGALRLNEETRKAFEKAGNPGGAAAADIQRAVFLEERDSAKSVELVNGAIAAYDKLQVHQCWRHHYLMHLHRIREEWDDVAAAASRYGIDRNDNPAPMNDAHEMMSRFRTRTIGIIPWSRLYPTEEAAAQGRPGGLTGAYYKAPNFVGAAVARMDPEISFRWGEGVPHPDLPADDFSVRWTGFLEPEFTDTYTFTIRCDDGARMWIGDTPLIDAWADGPPRYVSGKIELTAGKKVPLKVEYFEHGGGAQMELYWDCPSFAKALTPVSWALVCRNNFDVPGARTSFQDHPAESLANGVEASAGKLRLNFRRLGQLGESGVNYRSVRLEADVQLHMAESEAQEQGQVGFRACLDSVRQTEVGFGLEWPRSVVTRFYYDRSGPGFYAPRLDLRKPHRIALEVHQGRAAYLVDGKMIDLQFFPTNWSGTWSLMGYGTSIECDNLEVFVPQEKAQDTAKVRGLYDSASTAFLKKDLPEALGLLEQVAALQPRVEELGRLYAAYLISAHEGRALLDRRFGSVSDPHATRMLLEAEQALTLVEDRSGDPELIRKVRAWIDHATPVDSELIESLKETPGAGLAALYARATQARFERGMPGTTQRTVEDAYRLGMDRDPRAMTLKYALATFYRTQKRPEQAEPLLKELRERAPRSPLFQDVQDAKNP